VGRVARPTRPLSASTPVAVSARCIDDIGVAPLLDDVLLKYSEPLADSGGPQYNFSPTSDPVRRLRGGRAVVGGLGGSREAACCFPCTNEAELGIQRDGEYGRESRSSVPQSNPGIKDTAAPLTRRRSCMPRRRGRVTGRPPFAGG
jgi:hypothetical protein